MDDPRGRSCYGGNDDVVGLRFVLVVTALVACSVAGYLWYGTFGIGGLIGWCLGFFLASGWTYLFFEERKSK